jgi:dipeptidyl aminopeptidase/acylaminoacyl peptidase
MNPEDAWGVTNYHIWVADVSNRSRPRDLTARFDRQTMDLTISDTGEGFAMPSPLWSRDGRTIYFLATDEGNTNLFAVSSGGRKLEKVLSGKHAISGYSANGKKTVVVFLSSTPRSLASLYTMPLSRYPEEEPELLADHNAELLSEVKLSIPREVHFRSKDGTRIHGWAMKPPFARPGGRYPGILEIHGGPRVQYGNVFFHEFQFLAARGYTVFYCNPRGGQGYGEKHAGAIVCDWGRKDYEDVMAGAEYFSRMPFVRKNRIGVTGGSYGGYMTNWIVGHTKFFKAAVTQRSVTNLVSFLGSSDIGYDDYREFGGHVWDNFDEYVRMSPITYVRNIRTPLLIIHSEADLRCSIEQAEQLFTSLKMLGRTVSFLRFPEEPHGLSRGGRPDRRIERLRRIVGWFDKYLK